MTAELARLRFEHMVAAGAYTRRKRLEDGVETGPSEPSAGAWTMRESLMGFLDLSDYLDEYGIGIPSRRQQ